MGSRKRENRNKQQNRPTQPRSSPPVVRNAPSGPPQSIATSAPADVRQPLIPLFFKYATGIGLIIGFIVWLANLQSSVSYLDKSQNQSDERHDKQSQVIGEKLEEMKADFQTMSSEGAVTLRRFQDGVLERTDHRRQFQFMTPSSETWKFKMDCYGNSDPKGLKRFEWQKDVTEEKVEEFGSGIIRNSFTRGWRRYPYNGQGHYRDVGYWWVITVEDSFDLDRFVRFYTEFWGAKEVYVEELNARGTVMPDAIIPNPDVPPSSKRELSPE